MSRWQDMGRLIHRVNAILLADDDAGSQHCKVPPLFVPHSASQVALLSFSGPDYPPPPIVLAPANGPAAAACPTSLRLPASHHTDSISHGGDVGSRRRLLRLRRAAKATDAPARGGRSRRRLTRVTPGPLRAVRRGRRWPARRWPLRRRACTGRCRRRQRRARRAGRSRAARRRRAGPPPCPMRRGQCRSSHACAAPAHGMALIWTTA